MQARFLAELREFVRFPSVSTDPAHAGDVADCAAWLARHLAHIGLREAAVLPTAGHPVVYAEHCAAPGRPTLLVYGHYDVQPAAPLGAWTVPPFAGVVRGDKLYGRGASDDKGQLFTHLKALETLLRETGRLPLNVKVLLEGEEEIGSPNLGAFIRQHRHRLRADLAVLSDTNLLSAEQPALTYALRGSLSAEIEVRGPQAELHSGIFGGAAANPLQVLVEVLARLHDGQGRVAIPGFYDGVAEAAAAERAYLRRHGPSDAQLLRDARAPAAVGEPGYSLYERATLRPALTFNGLGGGYQGTGLKLVIPPVASAKLNFRLAVGQDPRRIGRLLRRYVAELAPPQVPVRVRVQSPAGAYQLAPGHPAMQAAAAAYRQGFGCAPVLQRSGGTIPVVNLFQELLGIPTVLMGFGLPDDGKHGPDEFFYLPNFWRGIKTSQAFLHAL